MGIGVAGFPEGHPETPNRMLEMDYLKAKVDAGADYIVTQLFFDNRDFFDYRERCQAAGINIPIVAGILPVTTKKMLWRLSELAAGSRIPASFSRWLERLHDEESVQRFGAHWAAAQIRELVDQETAGIHLYTLNLSESCLQIANTLGIEKFNQL
jgi:methylenetetrahydrofolate reductase (NADPH)